MNWKQACFFELLVPRNYVTNANIMPSNNNQTQLTKSMIAFGLDADIKQQLKNPKIQA